MFVWGHGEIMGLKANKSKLLSLGKGVYMLTIAFPFLTRSKAILAVN